MTTIRTSTSKAPRLPRHLGRVYDRAIKLPQYSDMKSFSSGRRRVIQVDKTNWLPADDTCPQDYSVAFSWHCSQQHLQPHG